MSTDPTRPPWQQVVDRLAAVPVPSEPEDLQRADAIERQNARLACVPRRYVNAELDHPALCEWLETFLEDPHTNGLLLCGPVGTGKSHLLWSVYRQLARIEGPRMEVVQLVHLLQRMRGANDVNEIMRRLLNVPLLAIDDLCAEVPTDWTRERLFELIDGRYVECRPLIVTTNAKPLADPNGSAEVLLDLDERLRSRVAESTTLVPVLGHDRRLTGVRKPAQKRGGKSVGK